MLLLLSVALALIALYILYWKWGQALDACDACAWCWQTRYLGGIEYYSAKYPSSSCCRGCARRIIREQRARRTRLIAQRQRVEIIEG